MKTIDQYKKIVKSWPKGLQEVNATVVKAVQHLKSTGIPEDKATDMVLDALKDCEDNIKTGQYSLVCELIEMIFLDKDVKNINIDKILNEA